MIRSAAPLPAIAALLRWAIAIALAFLVFFVAAMALLLLALTLLRGVDWAIEAAFAAALTLASCAFVSTGVVVAPHLHWRIALEAFVILLVLPVAASTISEVWVTGEAGAGGIGYLTLLGVVLGASLASVILSRSFGRRAGAVALSRKARFGIALVCAGALLLPLRSVTVPAWRLQYLDEQDAPFSGLEVRQFWKNYSVELSILGSDAVGITDESGFVDFPQRVLYAPLALRLWVPLRSALTGLVHASFGPFSHVVPLCPLGEVTLAYYTGDVLPERVHLRYVPTAGKAVDPRCERFLAQAKAVSAAAAAESPASAGAR